MEVGNKRKGGGNQTNGQTKLGNIQAILSETIQPVDDLVMLNYLHTKNGASVDRRYIRWPIEICDHPTDITQAYDRCL